MHRCSLFLLTLSVLSTAADAAIVVPVGLQPGDQYYLAFVTRDARNAASSDIAEYDAFVQAQAAQNAALTGTDMGVQWRVVGSTSSVSAKDHLSLGEFPIYLLDGTSKVADGGTDFWDGTLDYAINIDQFVDHHFTNVWTGTTADGTSIAGHELGGDTPIVGNSGLYYDYWAYKHSEPDEEGFALLFYGISELLTVPGANQTVPEPASIITWTAIGGMLLASRAVWRRKHSDRRPV